MTSELQWLTLSIDLSCLFKPRLCFLAQSRCNQAQPAPLTLWNFHYLYLMGLLHYELSPRLNCTNSVLSFRLIHAHLSRQPWWREGFPYPNSIKSLGGLTILVMIPPCDYNKFSLIPALQQWRKLAEGLQCVKHPNLLAAIKSRVKTKVLKKGNRMIVPLERCF